MQIRDVLIYFDLKYHGNWDEIYDAIARKERIDANQVESVLEDAKECVCLLDDFYPDYLKRIYKPPFVLSNEDLKVIEERRELASYYTLYLAKYVDISDIEIFDGIGHPTMQGEDILKNLSLNEDCLSDPIYTDIMTFSMTRFKNEREIEYEKNNENEYCL